MRGLRILVPAMVLSCGSKPSPSAGSEPSGSAAASPPPALPLLQQADAGVVRGVAAETARVTLADVGWPQRLLVLPDGMVVAAGKERLVRISADFDLDTSFGTRGAVTLGVSDKREIIDIAADKRGRIVVAGYVWTDQTRRKQDVWVRRLQPDGLPDPAFGNRGTTVIDLGATDDRASSVFVRDNGTIAVIGSHQQGTRGSYDGFLVTLDQDGRLVSKVLFDPIADTREFVTSAVPAQGGGYWVGGYALSYPETHGRPGIFVTRLREDGTLDENFGDKGTRFVEGVALGGSAWVLVTGTDHFLIGGGTAKHGFVARLIADGRLDTRWGDGGVAVVDGSWLRFDAVLPMGADTLVVGGHMIGRLTSSGALANVQEANESDWLHVAAFDSHGNLVVLGRGGAQGSFVARFAVSSRP